jgi:DNA-binding response OmpR family regulator
VIEDDDNIRRAVRTVLAREGYAVREARNGRIAMELWQEEPSDLIISDIHMPDKGGIETMLDLRALNPQLPIIAVSGSGKSTSLSLLLDAKLSGPICTLDKPFKLAELLACVRDLLGEASTVDRP